MRNLSKKNNDFELLDFNKILSLDILEVKVLNYEDQNNTLVYYLKEVLKLFKIFLLTIVNCIFYHPLIKHPKNNERNIFYIRSYSRPDIDMHSSMYEEVKSTTVCLTFKKIKKIDIRSFVICIFSIFKVRKFWIKVLNNNDINFFSLNGLKIFLSLLNSFSETIKILPLLIKHSKVVSFQEIRCTENILCQLANLNKIETFALEHAIGAHKTKGSLQERYTTVIYTSSVCKNILCWGKYSENLFKKYCEAKIYIVGKASLPKIEKITDGVTFIFQSSRWEVANKKLLIISNNLKRFNIPISHWFKDKNLLIENGILRDGPLHKIIIGSSTNLLVELGFLGFDVYLIKDSVFLDFVDDNLCIDNSDQIKDIYLCDNFYPGDVWKNFIECANNESISRYKKIIENK